ncbi:MAG: TonB-dependent receptor [Tannerellaceae bacterium]|nr:TonB-dependent receptor [Tannerellaceae bacterium]
MKNFRVSLLLMLVCFIPFGIYAQTIELTGQVVDRDGEPVIGANIKIKGTTTGTITDLDGHFNLPVTSESILEVSYIGYITQNIPVGQNRVLRIQLQEDALSLDEVVVVGYGTMKKSDLTGSVASANLKDFEKSPNTNLASSLQGSVPGLNIGQITAAGTTPSISIRGTNTLSGNKDVLIVLDGIIYTSSLSSINPADIESVDVLKDASATAVYGAQAANGVLLITSKKGKKGKTRISFNTSYSVSNPTKNFRPMNRNEYLSWVTGFYYDRAYEGPDYKTPNPDFRVADYLPDAIMRDNTQSDGIAPYDYSWWDEGTRTGYIQENKLSVSGGNEGVSYLLSFSNTNQEGFILNDDFRRNSIRMNIDLQPYKWLKLGVQAFGSFVNQDGAEPGIWALITQSPLITPYDDNGDLRPYPFNTLDTNPFMGSNISDRERHNYFFANIYTEINLPVKGLSYRFNFGNNYRIDEYYRASEYGASLTGEAYKRHRSHYDYTFDNILNYNREFGDHSIGATLLYGVTERKEDYTDAISDGFSRLTLGYNSLQQGQNQYTNSNAWSEALLYQMARVNYKFRNRYLVTATVRRDGFSGFAENNKTAVFPSLALGWVLSEEKFFNVSWVDHLKIRTGYGISGNQTERYKSLARVNAEAGYVFGDGGSSVIRQELTSLQNPNLKWEKTAGFNAAVDFNLLNNRLNGTLDLYRSTTKDLLYDIALPTITGFSQISTNIGKIRNQGIELTLNSRNIVTKDFEWSTTFNISSNSNKIISLLGKDSNGDGKEDDLIASNLFIGESTTAIYGYIIDGIWQVDDDIPTGYHPGNYKLRDVTGEGEITPEDRVILGREDPAYSFGIMNRFVYKDFSFSFFINSIQGGKNGYLAANSETLQRNDNSLRWNRISEMAADYWSPDNPNATYSRSISASTIDQTNYQSRSFVRLQDITLSYNLPKVWLKTIGIDNLNVYVNGKNLLTFTKWKGWDPEANSGYWGRPVMRSFTVGLNVTF